MSPIIRFRGKDAAYACFFNAIISGALGAWAVIAALDIDDWMMDALAFGLILFAISRVVKGIRILRYYM